MKLTRPLAIFALVLATLTAAFGQSGPAGITNVATLLNAVAVTGTGSALAGPAANKTYQAAASVGTGTGTAVVTVQCSNNASNWDTVGTITLSTSTTSASDSFYSLDRCRFLRGNVTTLSGTTPTLTLTMSY
jgi:hypothetical protein